MSGKHGRLMGRVVWEGWSAELASGEIFLLSKEGACVERG